MNIRDDDQVSAVALVVDDGEEGEAPRATAAVGMARTGRREPLDAASDDRAGDPGDNGRTPPCATSPPVRYLARPEKGGGPNLSDSSCGTLEVSGR